MSPSYVCWDGLGVWLGCWKTDRSGVYIAHDATLQLLKSLAYWQPCVKPPVAVQATNTTLRDSNSFLEQQLADAEAQLAKLRTTAPDTGGSATAQPSDNTADPPGGSAAAQPSSSAGSGVGSSRRSDNNPANVYELVEDGGSFRATYAGEPSYEAMKRKLEANFSTQV